MKAKELKLGPLPNTEVTRVTIVVTKPLKDALDLYAQDFAKSYGAAELPALIPHMLEAFLRSDKAFMKRHSALKPRAAKALPSASASSRVVASQAGIGVSEKA